MKQLRRLLMWFVMLSKRLYKKPTYLLILLLTPVLVLVYSSLSTGESGVITVGLAWYAEDPITEELVSTLQNSSELISFQVCDDPAAAETLLTAGKLDAIWLFSDNLSEKIQTFANKPTESNAFITVRERQDSVALMLSREKLNGVVYPYIAQQVYLNFTRDLAPELDSLTDEELLSYFMDMSFSDSLFSFEGATGRQDSVSYLLSPLRGMMGILILLCSIATAMYYIRDMEHGTFSWVSRRWLFLPELGTELISSFHIAVISLFCLFICGLAGNLWIELAVLLCYSICCAGFAMALRRIFNSVGILGTLIPLIIIACLIICPVFFDLGVMRKLQYLLPPTYYINAIYDHKYLPGMAVYSIGCFMIYYLSGKIFRKNRT